MTLFLLIALGVAFLLAVLAREAALHVFAPAAARQLRNRGQGRQGRALLERAAAAPSLFGERARRGTRFLLAWYLMEEGEYERGAEQCRTILRRRLPRGFEAQVRQRLADCLEGGGDAGAASEERELGMARLEGGRDGPDELLARARALRQEGKHAEACDVTQQALAAMRPEPSLSRSRVLLHLALASFDAGRPADTVRFAEEALPGCSLSDMRVTAHKTAGIGYSSQGRLEEAEQHLQEAFIEARRAGMTELAASILAQLAGIRMNRGRIAEAVEAAERAAGLSLKARRQARMVESECLRLWGRHAEARTANEQARRAPGHAVPAAERRSQAILLLGLAWIEAEAGEPGAALDALHRASADLQGDVKLELYCIATAGWLMALAGRPDEARAQIEEAARRTADFADDVKTRELCLAMAGRARLALGEPAFARDAWEEYLRLEPVPVSRPTAHYHLGECHAQLGDVEAARAAWRAAVDLGIDTHFARQAKRRLVGE